MAFSQAALVALFLLSVLCLSTAGYELYVEEPEQKGQNIQNEENEVSGEVVPVEFVIKRASNLGSRLDSRNCGAFNMGKKFGGYSWLRSADSTRRRLAYILGNKWQRDAETQELPSLQEDRFIPYRN